MRLTERKCVSVLIAHAKIMVAELIATALNRREHFRVIARVNTASEVRDAIQSTHADVVLISVNLQDGPRSGFRALRDVREARPDARVVMLLDNSDPQLVVDAFRAGAMGVFSPTMSEFKMLCRCVEQVVEGQIWANSSELREVVGALAQMAPLRVVNADGMKLLTKREEDVVRLLAEGMGNREIAHELKLSENTVRNYMFHVFDKLGVSNRVELLLYSISSTKRAQSIAGGDKEQPDRADEPLNELDASLEPVLS